MPEPADVPNSFYEFIALKRVDSQGPAPTRQIHFTTAYPPRAFGSAIAFGGSVQVAAVQAGYATLYDIAGGVAAGDQYSAFSLQGSFTGPSSSDIPLDIHVKTLRFTRTFATFLITVSQPSSKPPHSPRTTLVATFDFIKPGPTLLEFGPQPREPVSGQAWAQPEGLISYYDEIRSRAEEGVRKPEAIAIERMAAEPWEEILEVRVPPESLMSQNMGLLVPTLPTTQGHLHPTEKRAADWVRYTTPLNQDGINSDAFAQVGESITPPSANIAALTHIADTRLAFIVPATASISFRLLEYTVTLDFSLRFHQHQREIRADGWMLRELRSIAAAEGRSFGEARFWDRGGKLLATMTQQCLLRPFRDDPHYAIKLKL